MISGRDFLVLSDDPHGLPTSTIHLFRHLAPINRVFWWNIVNRMPGFTGNDVKKVAHTLRAWSGRSGNDEQPCRGHNGSSSEVVCSTTPFIIPWFKGPIRRLNCLSFQRNFQRLSAQHEIRDLIVLTTWPSTVDFVKTLDSALKIYYCVDEWSAYPGLNAVDFQRMEDELVDRVDGLVATSRDLESKGRRGLATLYLPQGVDFEHFGRPSEELAPVSAMERIPRPIVGFFGAIAPWIDLKLIGTLSEAFPDVSFVLIGKSEVSMDAVANRPNVHCLGLVPYADLPRYARYFDVGLIPFVTNKLTEAVNPLKLMEYYALGLPVLATRLRDLEQVDGPIRLATTEAEFRQGLKAILADSTFEAEEARKVARQNTWRQRAEKLSGFIESLS